MIRLPFLKQTFWQVTENYKNTDIGRLLSSFDQAYQMQGEEITKSSLCTVYKITVSGTNYYIKHYNQEENQLLRYFRQSKVKSEWKNMLYFQTLGIPAAKVVAYGEELSGFISNRGLFISEEIKNTSDLMELADKHSTLLKNTSWVKAVSRQIAEITRTLHQDRFAHNDLKWRNMLIDIKAKYPKVFLIDCPSGMKWIEPFLEYRIIKDLACLDKRGKYELSKKQRLAFYKDYAQCRKLTVKDKKRIRKIIQFFHNRE